MVIKKTVKRRRVIADKAIHNRCDLCKGEMHHSDNSLIIRISSKHRLGWHHEFDMSSKAKSCWRLCDSCSDNLATFLSAITYEERKGLHEYDGNPDNRHRRLRAFAEMAFILCKPKE